MTVENKQGCGNCPEQREVFQRLEQRKLRRVIPCVIREKYTKILTTNKLRNQRYRQVWRISPHSVYSLNICRHAYKDF